MTKTSIYILIALLLAFDNVFIRFRIGVISVDRMIEFLLFFAFFKTYLKTIRYNSFFRRWNTFLILFALLQLLVNLRFAAMGEMELTNVLVSLFKSFSFIVFSFLFFLVARENLKYVKIIVVVHLGICIFALLMHPISPLASQFFEIKKALFSITLDGNISSNLETENSYISGGYVNRFRLSGPFRSTISFTYFAITSFCMAFYLFIKTSKRFYLIVLGVVFICSLLSQTRSLLLGELIIIFGYLFFAPQKKRPLYQFGLVTIGTVIILFIAFGQNYFIPKNSRLTKVSSEGTSDSRPLLWLTGIKANIFYPFGVSKTEYKTVQREMYNRYGNLSLLHLGVHNGVINIGIYYSILGLFLLYLFVKFLIEHNRYSDPTIKIFFIMCLLGYLIHISFHNNIILYADYPFLMILIVMGMEGHKIKLEEQISISSY